ncbi:hypothetical protein GCM10027570_11090 [Streptomonospora sediminis]
MPTCVQCGKELTVPARGRRPRYCSRSCQARAYRARAAAGTDRAADQQEHGDAAAAGGPGHPARPPLRSVPERGEAPRSGGSLSRERIVRTAIRIADSDGLETMSMRHVAEVLGVKVMSLYHYISGKDELIDLMVEAVFNEPEAPERGPSGWRTELEAAARWEWSLYSTHPWVLEVIATVQPPLVPSLLSGIERSLRALDGLGLDAVTAHRVYLSVSGLVQGLALLRVSEIAAGQRGGVPLSQWRAVKVPAVLEELGADKYPRQAALRDSVSDLVDLEAVFEFSLHRHLDGLALFLEGTEARPPAFPGGGGAGSAGAAASTASTATAGRPGRTEPAGPTAPGGAGR